MAVLQLRRQSPGKAGGLPFTVDCTWTPEQALAVWELLDDLRDRIWTHYGVVKGIAAGAAIGGTVIPIFGSALGGLIGGAVAAYLHKSEKDKQGK